MTRLALAALLASASIGAQPQKKLIATGGDSPNPSVLRTIVDQVEQAPFQGLVVRFTAPGNDPYFAYAFTRDVWEAGAGDAIAGDLEACAFDRPVRPSSPSTPTRATSTGSTMLSS